MLILNHLFFFVCVYLCRHVQVNNQCAIEFYQKFGFEIVETRDQYYKRIEPAGAHVLEKNLRKSSEDSQTNSTDSATNLSNGITDSHSNNHHQHSKSTKATE